MITPSQVLRALPRGMTIAVAIAFVVLGGLGTWQIMRLKWKEGLVAEMARTEALAPVAADQLLAEAKPAWRSAILPQCAFDSRHLIYMHSELSGQPGYRVLSACPVAAGEPHILVDLGFSEGKLDSLDFFGFAPVGRLRPIDKPSAFAVVNRPADNDWYTREPAEMGKALGVPLRTDYFLVVDIDKSRFSVPGLQQGRLTAPLANRHFEYALTWYGLALALLGMFAAVVLQRTRKQARS